MTESKKTTEYREETIYITEPVGEHMERGTGEYAGRYYCKYCLYRESHGCWKRTPRRMSVKGDKMVYTCPGCFTKPARNMKYRMAVLRDVFGCHKVRLWLAKGIPLEYLMKDTLPTDPPF